MDTPLISKLARRVSPGVKPKSCWRSEVVAPTASVASIIITTTCIEVVCVPPVSTRRIRTVMGRPPDLRGINKALPCDGRLSFDPADSSRFRESARTGALRATVQSSPDSLTCRASPCASVRSAVALTARILAEVSQMAKPTASESKASSIAVQRPLTSADWRAANAPTRRCVSVLSKRPNTFAQTAESLHPPCTAEAPQTGHRSLSRNAGAVPAATPDDISIDGVLCIPVRASLE